VIHTFRDELWDGFAGALKKTVSALSPARRQQLPIVVDIATGLGPWSAEFFGILGEPDVAESSSAETDTA
jgi:hypothetical protein